MYTHMYYFGNTADPIEADDGQIANAETPETSLCMQYKFLQ